MNKLEQAIRKTADDGFYSSSIFSNNHNSCIEEIEKMENKFQLDIEAMKKKKIIYSSMDNAKLVNSFRELRSSIADGYGQNVIMVTALDRNSGTSFFSRNLASVIAFDASKTTILMDGNNQSPEIAETFDIENAIGINDYVYNPELNVEDIIYGSGIKRLRVIPAGNVFNRVDEQYSHPRFHNLLSDVKHKFQDRKIIIDSPPILNSADARILMDLCDQVIIVVPYGKVSKIRLEEAIKIIGREKFSGVVFNNYIN